MRRFVFVFLCVWVSSVADAQNTFRDAYNNFKQQAQANNEDFRKKANEEYAEWMQKAWEWHQNHARHGQ